MKTFGPPPVHHRLTPCTRLAFVLATAQLMLGFLLFSWVMAAQQAKGLPTFVWLATALAYGFCAYLTYRWYKQLPTGWLLWTGKVWRLSPHDGEDSALPPPFEPTAQTAQTTPMHPKQMHSDTYRSCLSVLDCQCAMLLKLEQVQTTNAPRTRWVWAHATHTTAENWSNLRRALVFKQNLAR